MTAAKIATALVLVSMIGQCHAQENSILQPFNQGSVVVATQTNARSNYALLQPIGKQSQTQNNVVRRQLGGMLKPIASESAASNDVLVLPHSFKRGIFDRHQFMIRNDGNRILKRGKVSLTAPVGSMIQQVIPKPDSVNGLNIELAIGELAPGEHEIVEVAIKYPRDELAHFDTKIVSRDWVGSPSNASSVVASNGSGMLSPRATGMLKPKVPAMTVSTTTNQVARSSPISSGVVVPAQERPVDVSKMLAPSTPVEAQPATLPEEVQPLEVEVQPSDQVAVSVQEESVAEVPPPEPENWVASIEASLHGPSSAAVGEEIEFSIEVENRSAENCESVIIQLSVPEDMKVTVLDRAAWYDGETRKVSWEIAELGPGQTESIRYKALVKTGCSVEQVVVSGANGRFQCKSTIQTTAN